MTNDRSDFTQGNILKKLVSFMMPILGALILQAAYGAVDLLVVGRFGSTAGLSAVSTGSQVLNLVTFVVVQFAMGITVLIARYLGERRPEKIGAVIGGGAIVFTMISAAFLIFSILAAITFGNADLSLKDVYSVIAYKLFHIKSLSAYAEGAVHDVVWLIRLPRVLLALAVGMALSVCGVVMQAIVQNPLADPYVLGISSGASLGATLVIMLGVDGFLGGNSVGVTAFIGAMVTSFAVIAIANMGGKATSAKLILAGMAVSAVCSAFSNFIIYITNDKNAATEVMKWMMGSLAGASWSRVGVMLPVTLICVIIFWTQYRNLNLMLLGDDVSITLGTDLHRLRTFYLIVASVMIGFAVYCAGVIGFVGLVIPHVIRILFGTDHRRLLPLSALLGASFLIWCDVACRVILKNSEMPIGVLVSIIGAPCFIYLLVRKSYGFGGSK